MRNCLKRTVLLLIISISIYSCKSEVEQATVSNPKISWKLASTFSPSIDLVYGTAENFCGRVSELTNGKFTITPYPSGTLTSALGVFDAVQTGAVEMGQSAGFYYSGKNKALVFDTGVPFGLSPRQQNAWLYKGGGIDLLRDIYSEYNIMYFPSGNTGHQMGGWFKNDINDISDLKGLRIRIPGLGGEIFSKLGASVSLIPGGEIYTALERGAIDATEWLGPHDDLGEGFNKIANNYYYPNWWEQGTTVALYINMDAWNKLPLQYQAVIEIAAKEANIDMLNSFDHYNSIALEELKKTNIALKKFDDSIINAAKYASTQIMEESAKENEDFNRIYQSWKVYQNKQDDWFSMQD